jgi:hypothetical protein
MILLAIAVAFVLSYRAFAAENPPALWVKVPAGVPEVLSGHLKMGGTNPDGVEINANSRYLTRGGKPWLPVMGEFHFSRYPASQWEDEILKMKSCGIQIVATYFFWIHHEEEEGKFVWTGDRDVRHFIELCKRHGLLVYLRMGPWSHGEVRNGGYPDWLLTKSNAEGIPLRSEDPRYLAIVRRYYSQMAEQIKGLRWKDGGPIIGGQVENELYRGASYLLTLKNMAREVGLDFPLYTLTGWGGANIPPDELIPLFGFCLDNFWDNDTTTWDRSVRQNYFFDNTRDHDLIGMGLAPEPDPNHPVPLTRYPYLTCETGGGVQVSYTRRPYISGHDAAPMSFAKLGSGSNMPGYYMFHGGSNPIGKLSTMQESLETGYPNDMPVISYDSQAPLREFGQVNESYHEMRPMHLFLGDFGARLAPMATKRPAQLPDSLDDKTMLRWAVRSDGKSGFVFINNYQRIDQLPDHKNVRLHVELADETIDLPRKGLTVPSGATALWPFNFDIGGALLKYATAQPLCRLADDKCPTYVFFGTPADSEFAFDAKTVESISGQSIKQVREDGRICLDGLKPGKDCQFLVNARDGTTARVLLLSRGEALRSYKANVGGQERLLISPSLLLFDGPRLRMQSGEPKDFCVDVFPAVTVAGDNGFSHHAAAVSPRNVELPLRAVKEPQPSQPAKTARGKAQAPSDADFERAGVWQVPIPNNALDGVNELIVAIDYEGDVGRAYIGDRLIADDFYDGRPWEIGLRRFAPSILGGNLTLKILPLRKDAPIYIAPEKKPAFAENDEAIRVRGIKAIPVYDTVIDLNAPTAP